MNHESYVTSVINLLIFMLLFVELFFMTYKYICCPLVGYIWNFAFKMLKSMHVGFDCSLTFIERKGLRFRLITFQKLDLLILDFKDAWSNKFNYRIVTWMGLL